MTCWRTLRDPRLSWLVPPYKTLEFWAVYPLWITATIGFGKAVLSQHRPLALIETIWFVAVLVSPLAGIVGLLWSHSHIRHALRDSPSFVSSEAGREFFKHATAIRLQMLVLAIAMQAFVALAIENR